MQISGLTKRQVEICDRLWSMDTDEIENYMRGLSQKEFQEVYSLMQLMLAEYLDTQDLGDCAEAKAVIKEIQQL